MASPTPIGETRTVVERIMMPMDANPAGNVYGGSILKYIDEVATIVAVRHTRTNVVTASIDRMDFLAPMHVGDLLMLRAAINYTGRSSMEIGVRVEAEDPRTGRVVHAGSCYLTMVALDGNGRPTPVPPVSPSNDEERAWFENGRRRREQRLKLRERLGQD
ncbi:MAG TPA: acyl-CoA thioesterase [Thermoplasmata archaeon]|nr:acyl-CoA thioesterase [Thermoplasmata archaeon]